MNKQNGNMNNIQEPILQYDGYKILIDPAKLLKKYKLQRTIIYFIPIYTLIIFFLTYFFELRHTDQDEFLLFIFLFLSLLPLPFVFRAVSWMFPRLLDPVKQEMVIRIPLFKLRYDIGGVEKVVVRREITPEGRTISVVFTASAHLFGRKQIEILRATGDEVAKQFKTTVRQICSAMGWKYEESEDTEPEYMKRIRSTQRR